MRPRTWVLVAVLAVSAGCVGSSGGDAVEDTGGQTAPLPAAITDERYVEIGVSPLDSASQEACQGEASECYRYPFDVATDARIQAHLDWANATNDFDLHVVNADGERVISSATGPADTGETIDAEIAAGSYDLVVVAYIASSDTYTLEAHFGYP